MRDALFNAQPPAAPQQIEAAQQRALDLLMSCLTEEQRENYRLRKCIRVVSNKGNIFEITHARMHNVFRLDMAGQRIEEWCVVALGQVPICDGMLAQKMWLETDEDHVMKHSNITVLRNGQLVHRAAEALQFSYVRDAALASQVQQVFQ